MSWHLGQQGARARGAGEPDGGQAAALARRAWPPGSANTHGRPSQQAPADPLQALPSTAGVHFSPVEEERAVVAQRSVPSGRIPHKVRLHPRAFGVHRRRQRALRRLPHRLALLVLCEQTVWASEQASSARSDAEDEVGSRRGAVAARPQAQQPSDTPTPPAAAAARTLLHERPAAATGAALLPHKHEQALV